MQHNWALIWADEFDGTALDAAKWNTRQGNWALTPDGRPVIAGWGNNEQQYYQPGGKNLAVQGGCLHLIAKKEPAPEQFGRRCQYTSARIDTHGKFAFCYGMVEFRAKCPAGAGLWPAVWMMPEHSVYGDWACSGEIDLLEVKGRTPEKLYGTIHYGGPAGRKTQQTHAFALPAEAKTDVFHTYRLYWEPHRIAWEADGVIYGESTAWPSLVPGIAPPQPFDQPFYLIVNLAVGGWFDELSVNAIQEQALPAAFVLDYIRVYQAAAGA